MIKLLITFTASFLIWVMVLAVFVFLVESRRKKIREVLTILISPVAAAALSWLVKAFFPYASRPFQINGFPPLTLTMPFNASFPSDHAAVAFALAISVFLYNKKLGLVFLASALLVGVARVLSNVHYPVDILGGALLGSFVVLAVDTLLHKTIDI